MLRWIMARAFCSFCIPKSGTTHHGDHLRFLAAHSNFQLCKSGFSLDIEAKLSPKMDCSASFETHHDPHAHAAAHEHHELGFWRKYIFSTDHKVIGIQYGITGLLFLLLGFSLMMLMRWQLAYPGQALPVIGKWLPHIFGAGSMPDGKMTPDFYNSLGAMHGTIMIFAGVVPLAFAAFGNFVVPLQIGAPDMTFPKVNAASF